MNSERNCATDEKQEDSSADLISVFEQRAEHLSREELRRWTPHTERNRGILRKLLAPGAKLLIGPRGSGKSTLLRTAYFSAIDDRDVLPVYVNYGNSLALEPLFHRTANALQIFRQWLLFKIVHAIATSFESMRLPLSDRLRSLSIEAEILIRGFESGGVPSLPADALAPELLAQLLEDLCDAHSLKRCILFMDDAAHAFSPEQQREFFEVFRGLRSRRVASKAAVYPGITSYSANFHAGHDAELVEVWSRSDESFIASMRRVVDLRLPEVIKAQLAGRDEIVELLALASFGLPRGFLNMLSTAIGVDEGAPLPLTRRRAEAAIHEHAESVRALFSSLRGKLPRFANFVSLGSVLDQAMASSLRGYNKLTAMPRSKTNIVAIREPIPASVERLLNMLEYAGLVRAESKVSRGEKGVFRRFALHTAIVVTENVLALGKSYSISDLVEALSETSAHAFVRVTPGGLLGPDFEERCVLNLPACEACGCQLAPENPPMFASEIPPLS